MKHIYTFRKQERLCSKKAIGELFETGNILISYPITVKWIKKTPVDACFPAKVLFVVSKKHFKSAVKRNRIKRLFRESYRQNKQILHEFLIQNNISIFFSVAYVQKIEPNYHFINDKLKGTLNMLIEQIKTEYEESL